MNDFKVDKDAFGRSASFVAGQEAEHLIGHYLNCSASPYDLRPAADIIVEAIHEARSHLPEGTPLVVLMGENHARPTEVALQQLVSRRLAAEEINFTVNIELSHNRWGLLAKHGMEKSVPDDLYYNPGAYDPDGQASLSAFLGFDGLLGAAKANDDLFAFWQEKGIATAFNDAAIMRGVIDLNDAFTASVVRECIGDNNLGGVTIDCSDPESVPLWMEVRNNCMASRAISFAGQHDAGVVLQKAGAAHLFGRQQDACDFETSLSSAFQKAGAAVLPVFITTPKQELGLNILPEAAWTTLANSVVIDGLGDEEFCGMGLEDEKKYLETLNQESGGQLSLYDVTAEKEHYKALAQKEADKVIERYNSGLPAKLPSLS